MKKLLFLLILPSLISSAKNSVSVADSAMLKQHVFKLCNDKGFRTIKDTAALNRAGTYIFAEMGKYAANVHIQPFIIKGKTYQNIICSFGPKDAPRIVIGAHYDVCGDHPGADDNTSGVAGLLELTRLLSAIPDTNWKYNVELVAYTLEEPPAFEGPDMGSAYHAKNLFENHVNVFGMISLEMIGFYRDGKRTQHYPAGFLKLFYGSRGNFITVVKKLHSGPFTRRFKRRFRHSGDMITKVFAAPPAIVPGVDLSDHRNYWAYNWDALMITDTSFFRNENYHKTTDTPETLDYTRMSFVVTKVFNAISTMVF